ncbi:MAG: hypothetical protein PUE12_18005 [Oscillospiraceae bacterium]|nr:hypothetical protein [Oscillospiraceae bacterium]
MIITLIVIGIIIGTIACFIIYDRTDSDLAFGIGLVLSIIAFIATLFVGISIIHVQVNKDIAYQNKLYEREMLEYRIEHIEENITGNEMLYNDIVEFNNELRSIKKWANNPFTNWFYVEDIAMIDYIELDDK